MERFALKAVHDWMLNYYFRGEQLSSAEQLARIHFDQKASRLQGSLHYIILHHTSEGETLPEDRTIEAGLKR